MAQQVKGVLIEFCCLNKIIPRLEKPETYRLFIADPLYLHTTARNVAVQSYTVTKIFNWNLYDIKYTSLYWGDIVIATVYPNPRYNEGLL
jgi:hypothetical protein